LNLFRAKTNQASPPGICEVPKIVDVKSDYIVIEILVPSEGGSTILSFIIESMDLDDNSTKTFKFGRNASDHSKIIQFRLQNLETKRPYIFRCIAESIIGPSSSFSDWTKETSTL
jgi:hypothetical protein